MIVLGLILVFGSLIAIPFWLFYRQTSSRIDDELQKLPVAANIPLGLLLAFVAANTFIGQRPVITATELLGDAFAWLTFGILYAVSGKYVPQRNRRLAFKVLVFAGVAVLVRSLGYLVRK